MGKSKDKLELAFSLTNLNDVGDLQHKLAPFTTEPTQLTQNLEKLKEKTQ